ncbi:carboxylate-amine ligase [Jatrophihabitans endophyticus]|uniref:Putative glutamate--cysteine ligase 2 n=1 Tax=Jatrophihabitans endophyticus TaxID=1206085 RepID=A0A1M5G6U7_9ACTN|nr:glutamate--cysteine ligase [Jatrophihabitans endophyticus]SHF99453.1 carboxylate-amine ligase [Jatrophihabitans endophyticus]
MHIDFSPSPRTSLGVEWELELVDLDTRELTGASDALLAAISPEGDGEHPKAKHELLQSCVEVITGVCTTVAEARADLAGTVGELQGPAAERNVGLMCSGTHPMTDWSTQRVTDTERYHQLIERNQWLARQLQIFGVHVHCGVRAPEKAIPIVNALLGYLPHFLSLSASSPYWIGSDTGLASYRSKVFEALPTAGLPYQLGGWEEFEKYMDILIHSHAIESIREVWWDIRPHPNFGTVELRICDGLPSLDEISCVAALAQCLVERFDHQLDDGYTLPEPRPWLVRENKWRAARYGLDAEIVVDNTGRVQPVTEAITNLVEDLLPLARRLDCAAELELIPKLIERGASYQRQRACAAAHEGKLEPVVDLLIGEMRDGLNL